MKACGFTIVEVLLSIGLAALAMPAILQWFLVPRQVLITQDLQVGRQILEEQLLRAIADRKDPPSILQIQGPSGRYWTLHFQRIPGSANMDCLEGWLEIQKVPRSLIGCFRVR